MDRRYLAATRRAFERATGLGEAQYFHEAVAGGALNNPYPDFPNFPDHSAPNPNGADYVYNSVNGTTATLVAMGWQVHLEHCGGLGELHNEEIVAAFQKLIRAKYFETKYPNVQHIFLVQPTLTLNFCNLGDYIAWFNVNYTDLYGQPCRWQSDRMSQGVLRSIEIPAGAKGLSISGGSIGYQNEVGQPMQITNATLPDGTLSAGGTRTYYSTGTFSNPIGSDTALSV
ncbi:MAG TPA: hypothetical protein VFV38_23445 [Ktedonobacteraceae bacterium]|nr:hypothetical protein [Ktedonobacteraceae bacterium]